MSSKFVGSVLATALLCFAGFGLLHTLTDVAPSLSASKLPEVLLYAGLCVTGLCWLVLNFRPSKAGNWLLYASAVGAVWLNGLAHLATSNREGFASASVGEWLRIALGALVLLAFLAFAERARRQSRRSGRRA